ncbi:hypothetical protein BDV27DRAFT_121087 [Aspergillus caelatus]|uniref:Uncharacterized protein n=1 Tax=Aspergillus caelatus TaxID=61420 RepID=A0A5N7AHS5_9EURO|nr:uncharacterized protein BDV27DRAFT_121087 [Aspergillus caelatus]KAE8369305.1 hypothetical protein BDV27DRAFT_121087 [Aspergillus caelatus]
MSSHAVSSRMTQRHSIITGTFMYCYWKYMFVDLVDLPSTTDHQLAWKEKLTLAA